MDLRVEKTYPYSVIHWDIVNFLNGPLNLDFLYETPDFVTHLNEPIRWKLGMIGRHRCGGCYRTTLFLRRSFDCTGPETVHVSVKMSICDRKSKVWWTKQIECCYGVGKNMAFRDGLKFDDVVDSYGPVLSSDGTFMVRCEIISDMSEHVDMRGVDLDLRGLSEDLKAFREMDVASDFQLRHPEENLPVHMAILYARSPLIAKRMDENLDFGGIDFPDIGGISDLKKMVSYWYSGDLRPLFGEPTFTMCDFISKVDQKEIKRYFNPFSVNIVTTFESNSCTMTWKIENYSKFEDYDILESPVFSQFIQNEETTCRFVLHPRGTKDDTEHMSLFVIFVKGYPGLTAHLEASLLEHGNELCYSKSTLLCLHPYGNFGFPDFMNLDLFYSKRDSLIMGDSLSIRCILKLGNGRAKFHEVEQTCSSAVSSVMSCNTYRYLAGDLKKLYESRDLSDIVLKVGAKKYELHKAILAARSKFFREMVKNYQGECGESFITIPHVDPGTFEMILKYMYYADPIVMDPKMALRIYPLAQKYQITRLAITSSEYLRNCLTIDNVLTVVETADLFDDSEMVDRAKRFINDNWEDITKSSCWKTFKRDNEELVSAIVIPSKSNSRSSKKC